MAPFSLFDGSITYAKATVLSLISIIKAAEQHISAEKALSARLYEDMNPLSFQITAVSVISRRFLWRLDGLPDPLQEITSLKLDTWEAILAHLEATVQVLSDAEAHRDAINAKGEAEELTEIGGPMAPADVTGKDYIYGSSMPNVTFHLNMAYATLRKEGVPLGKKDYLAPYMGIYIPQAKPKEVQGQ